MKPPVLESVEPSPRFRRWFAWMTRRMIARAFERVRVTASSPQVLQAAAQHPGPLLIASNHAAWWDPLMALRLAEAYTPGRPLCCPIEMDQYQRFRLLRKLGLFGLEHRHPHALPRMIQHVSQRVAQEPNLLFCITPQGRFTDVRRPIRTRPGLAALAAALPTAHVLVLCGEYTFWHDRRPQALWHALPCDVPNRPTTAGWHRAVQSAMQTATRELAQHVIARDDAAFTSLPGDGQDRHRGTAVHPAYDAWLRLRGVGTRIEPDAPPPPRRDPL